MAGNNKATALEQATNEATEIAVQVSERGNFIVERETFTSNGRKMFGYYVKGKYRGREIKVDLSADDQGGYENLDMIFDIAPTAELSITEAETTNNDGSKMKYTVYEVFNIDEDGINVRYKVKPSRKSDLSNLNVLLQLLERQKAKEEAEAEAKAKETEKSREQEGAA